MTHIDKMVEETLSIAQKNFESFGFDSEQIKHLLASGERDLRNELEKLKVLLRQTPADITMINRSLHALKGLLYNLGNIPLGDKMNALRNMDSPEALKEVLDL